LLFQAHSSASDAGSHATLAASAELAAGIALDPRDEEGAFLRRLVMGLGAMVAGDPATGAALLDEALASPAAAQDARYALWASASALWLGDDERVTAMAERAVTLGRARGALGILVDALSVIGVARVLVQRFDDAVVAAEEGLAYARELGAENLVPLPLVITAVVAAVRGQDDLVAERASEALHIARAHGLALREANAMRALALLDLGRGRWADALQRYQ